MTASPSTLRVLRISHSAVVDAWRARERELRDRGVLVGTTRREQNVLKIRPPLCISRDEAALIVSNLDDVLTALEGGAT